LDVFGLTFRVVPPPFVMRQFVKIGVFLPERLGVLFVGAAEMAGCVMFDELRRVRQCIPMTARNCGSCGHACAPGEDCCSDVCTRVDTTANCGKCGIACVDGQECRNGRCVCPNSAPVTCGLPAAASARPAASDRTAAVGQARNAACKAQE
jgi:hypothetical protein